MAVDRGMIDEDHQHLIDIINRFGAHMTRGSADLGGAVDVLNALKFYTETHFAREERLQRLVGYPESQLQHDEHRRLLATLDEIIARTRSTASPDAAQVMRDMNALLRGWLLNHIIKLDLRMKPYAEQMRRHAKGLSELRAVKVDSSVFSAAV
jgi:hemerythrin-like metal-binding protein